MNKVVYIEANEEVTEIIDRLKNIREEKLALVVPSGAILLSGAVNLRLLKEKSTDLGKEISIVTSDSAGGAVATSVGFVVYENLDDAREIKERDIIEKEKSFSVSKRVGGDEDKIEEVLNKEDDDYTDLVVEKKSQKETSLFADMPTPRFSQKHSTHASSKKAWVVAGGVLVVLVILLTILFPRATVYLAVFAQEEEISIPFNLTTSLTAVDESKPKTLPAKWENKERSLTIEFPATGEKNVGNKAGGMMVLYNRSGKTRHLAVGTEFINGNKSFINVEEATVPGAIVSDFGELIPGKSSFKVEASSGGSDYNIEPSRFSIPAFADVSGLIYGISEETFSGGTDRQAKVVTQEDLKNAEDKTVEKAGQEIEDEFGIEGNTYFVNGLAKSEIADISSNKKEDDEADNFTMTAKIKFSFLVFDKKDFESIFKTSADSILDKEQTILGDGYRSVSWDVVKFDAEKGQADVVARATVRVVANLDEGFLKSKIVGMKIPEIRELFSQYPEVDVDKVRFFPPITVRSVPNNEDNVKIKINYLQ